MKKPLLLLALVSFACFAQAPEEVLQSQLMGVASYIGILLLSFLFTLIAVIPFVEEVMNRDRIRPLKLPIASHLFWALEALAGLSLVLLTISFSSVSEPENPRVLMYVISAVCAFLPFSIFMAITFVSNIYKRSLLENIFSMVLWGVVASGASLLLNMLLESVLERAMSHPETALLVFAAFFEEALKGIGLAELFKRYSPGPVLGMLYGFSIGVGFAMIENWMYFSYVINPAVVGVASWTHVLFYRAFFTNMAHGFFSASNALVVSSFPNSRHRFLSGLLCASLLHLVFNLTLKANLGSMSQFFILGLASAFLFIVYKNMTPPQVIYKRRANNRA